MRDLGPILKTLPIALLSLQLLACPEDKEPPPDFGLDVLFDGGTEPDADTDDRDEPRSCDDHDDCEIDELCDDELCVDRSDVDLSCDDENDCPEGFICVEEECELD